MGTPETVSNHAEALIAREYAEALVQMLRRVTAHFPEHADRAVTRPIAQYAGILAEKLGVGLPEDVDGVDRVSLFEALHALQHLGCYLERAKHATILSPTRHVLLLELHTVTMREVARLLRAGNRRS